MFSLVSATVFVASAVAVRVTPPLAAVHVPLIGTVTLAPAAIAPAVPFRVVLPAARRVTVPAATALVPRLSTVTVKETCAPTAGAAGLGVIAVTVRSGPGLCPTTSFEDAVRLLFVSSCSTTVPAGSTTADTV